MRTQKDIYDQDIKNLEEIGELIDQQQEALVIKIIAQQPAWDEFDRIENADGRTNN